MHSPCSRSTLTDLLPLANEEHGITPAGDEGSICRGNLCKAAAHLEGSRPLAVTKRQRGYSLGSPDTSSSRRGPRLATQVRTSLTRGDRLGERPAEYISPAQNRAVPLSTAVRLVYAELEAEQQGVGLFQEHHPAEQLQWFKAFSADLRALLAALDDPLVGNRRPRLLAEVQAAVVGERQLAMGQYISDAAAAAMHANIVQHNFQQPWNTVLQAHKDTLARAGLSLRQRASLGRAMADHFATMHGAQSACRELHAALAQERDIAGPLVRREALRIVQTKALVTQLQRLKEAESRARVQIVNVLICNEVLDSQQIARIQLSGHPAVFTDLPMVGRLVLDSLDPQIGMQPLALPDTVLNNRFSEHEVLAIMEEGIVQPGRTAPGFDAQCCIQSFLELQNIMRLLQHNPI